MAVRSHDPATDADGLWRLKAAFERELGAAGSDAKERTYEAKLTPAYRRRYLDWVERCVAESPDCVQLAAADGELEGYAFLLPASLAMIWDAAVLNEIYVEPARRGTGLADELLAAALDLAREQAPPLDRMVLDVAPSNDRARAFYARHGFEPWGELVATEL